MSPPFSLAVRNKIYHRPADSDLLLRRGRKGMGPFREPTVDVSLDIKKKIRVGWCTAEENIFIPGIYFFLPCLRVFFLDVDPNKSKFCQNSLSPKPSSLPEPGRLKRLTVE
ncbi:hypothetical protein CEXT_706051 [Caerostris extrusa]|uniref:Uncharacterized protein n=1 Tax=Caerostris extrusa TaxID=172846 RepID=A0AAV4XFS4_CAEEX|nr:hypothetical protein CEXT_706051 [Caerostris extrusa]